MAIRDWNPFRGPEEEPPIDVVYADLMKQREEFHQKSVMETEIQMAKAKLQAEAAMRQNLYGGVQQANTSGLGGGCITGIQGNTIGPVTTSGTYTVIAGGNSGGGYYTPGGGGGGSVGGYVQYPSVGNGPYGQTVTVGSTGLPGSYWANPMPQPPGQILMPAPQWSPKTGDTITYKYVDGFGWQLEDTSAPYRAPPVPGFSMEEIETATDLIESIENNRMLEKA